MHVGSPVKFSIVRALLESKGYVLDRISGSHHIFTKPEHPLQSIPVHKGKVKYVYYLKVQKLPD